MLFCCNTTCRRSGTSFSTLDPCLQTYWIISSSASSLPLSTLSAWPERMWKVCQGVFVNLNLWARTMPKTPVHDTLFCTIQQRLSKQEKKHCYVPGDLSSTKGFHPQAYIYVLLYLPTLFFHSHYENTWLCCELLFSQLWNSVAMLRR